VESAPRKNANMKDWRLLFGTLAYGAAAERVARGGGSTCCCAKDRALGGSDPITSDMYDGRQAADMPQQALLASLGCGNPTALAELKPGILSLAACRLARTRQ
jgi:hypothetical protein